MRALELLAPARNADIGIAAIDCGADAVYIAGPEFGARQAAGNSVDDIRRLCSHARLFGARIYVTLNTILYDDELGRAEKLIEELYGAGIDALIVQDAAVSALVKRAGIQLPLHASTQCAIRTPERAAFLESLGYSRLVLERQLSLGQIKAVRAAVDAELECFVHGALCVCYSGQCYLSEYLAGRSANRGECIQACRSLYDLEDLRGRTLAKNKALLSLKDLNLLDRLEDLADAGVMSFKIEGRLKNISYVRNVTRAYSAALDALVEKFPEKYCRSSYGSVSEGVPPDPEKTFNRGYTALFIDGKRGRWAAMDNPKSMGEEIGTVTEVSRRGDSMEVHLRPLSKSVVLNNGDGFSFNAGASGIMGFRGDVCKDGIILCKNISGLRAGTVLFRNIDVRFEKELERRPCRREIKAVIDIVFGDGTIKASAVTSDGRVAEREIPSDGEPARDAARMEAIIRERISKRTGRYLFSAGKITGRPHMMKAAETNGLRRILAEDLDRLPCASVPMAQGIANAATTCEKTLDYKENVSNSMAREIYSSRGAATIEGAYETGHPEKAELMRTKYCIRYELGLCPKNRGDGAEPLFLINNGRRMVLRFDCGSCEMTLSDA